MQVNIILTIVVIQHITFALWFTNVIHSTIHLDQVFMDFNQLLEILVPILDDIIINNVNV
jgi:hypothetical protein